MIDASNGAQRAALGLAITPLVLGAIILGSWWITRAGWLWHAGIVLIFVGFGITLVVGGLLLHGFGLASQQGFTARQRWRNTLLVLSVMFANYPAAYVAIAIVYREMCAFTVTLVNDAATPWSSIVLAGGGAQHAVTEVAAGATQRCKLWFSREGTLVLTSQDSAQPVVVDGYVTNGLGGGASVVRKDDGRLVVTPTDALK